MILFITILVLFMILFAVSIILAFRSYRRKRSKKIISIDSQRKVDNRSMLISALGLISSILGVMYTLFNSVPVPTIYPLDNEAKIYNERAKVYIDSNPLLKTYYSLNGSDPKDGHIYEGDFIITKTTTVSARNKFLIFWSDLSQSTFRFESAQNITVTGEDTNKSNGLKFEGFFIYTIIILFLITGLVSESRGPRD